MLPHELLLFFAAAGASQFVGRRVARQGGIDVEAVLSRTLLPLFISVTLLLDGLHDQEGGAAGRGQVKTCVAFPYWELPFVNPTGEALLPASVAREESLLAAMILLQQPVETRNLITGDHYFLPIEGFQSLAHIHALGSL